MDAPGAPVRVRLVVVGVVGIVAPVRTLAHHQDVAQVRRDPARTSQAPARHTQRHRVGGVVDSVRNSWACDRRPRGPVVQRVPTGPPSRPGDHLDEEVIVRCREAGPVGLVADPAQVLEPLPDHHRPGGLPDHPRLTSAAGRAPTRVQADVRTFTLQTSPCRRAGRPEPPCTNAGRHARSLNSSSLTRPAHAFAYSDRTTGPHRGDPRRPSMAAMPMGS